MPLITSFLSGAVKLFIAILLIVWLLMYLFQEKMLFIRTRTDDYFLKIIREKFPNAELWVDTRDHVRLHGWFHKRSDAEKAPAIIYFGGNAEDISEQILEFEALKGWAVLLMNYRGYGLSGGKPSQKNLFDDALSIYDHISRRADVDASRIVVMGRSLGSGVAVYLASQRPLAGVILVSPYDSIRSVAQKIYPFAPVSLLLKHPFDAAALAPSVKIPMLALIAAEDNTIPPVHSDLLIKKWGGKVIRKVFDGADHNTIQLAPGYWNNIQIFLDTLLSKRRLSNQ